MTTNDSPDSVTPGSAGASAGPTASAGQSASADQTASADQIVAMLSEQAMAMCAQGSRAPSLVRVSAGDLSVQVEWWDSTAAADRSSSHGSPATAVSATAVSATAPAGVPATVTQVPAAAAAVAAAPATNKHEVCAQMVGVFYRASGPGAKPFVAEGDMIASGQQIGIVEAMKLMIPVEADRAGRVIEILVADGVAVEHGQPLLVMEPQR